jgi:hypothetical protein
MERIKPPPANPEEASFYEAQGEIEFLFEGTPLFDR